MSFWTGISQLRTILATETDYDSPNSEELMEQIRENIEALFMLIFDTGVSGAADSDPPDDTTGVLTDAAPGFVADVHNGRTLLITSGLAMGNLYTIDNVTATTIDCTDDNLYSDGVREADTYKILYDVKVNADGHDHDGINSKSAVLADNVITQAKVADDAIGQQELKTAYSNQSEALAGGVSHIFTLGGGQFSFASQVKGSAGVWIQVESDTATSTDHAALVKLHNTDSVERIAYCFNTYVEASGEVFWLFIRRNKISKKIIGISACPDHPCFGCGGKPLLRPHPFGEYDTENEEIVLINPTKEEVREMQKATEVVAEDQPDRDFTDVIREDYEIDEESTPDWPKEKVTVALPPDWNEAWLERRKVTPVKKVIPQPTDVIVRSLKKKAGKL